MFVTFLVATAIDTAKLAACLSVLFAALMINRRTRRVTMAVIKYTNRHSPSWAKPAMVAAAFIPGQADEIALVAILLIPILRNARNRRVLARSISYAWNG